jgi:hypothetical protein
VKQAVFDSKYSALVAELLKDNLQKQNVTAAEMVHVPRKSIWEEQIRIISECQNWGLG